jgi:2-C-methyl-D-erythritol 4-phosphate cytidylyltransferase/2-C-methyl-D-erythritol 2,4-cyclodiphosphate synthase
VTLSVIVVAAGSGERLGSARPKAFVDLAGSTLLERSLGPIADLDSVDQVVVVAPSGWVEPAQQLAAHVLGDAIALEVVEGGATRTDSVRRGLERVDDSASIVLIHDAARCMTPREVFERVIAAIEEGAQGVIPTLDVVDTMVPRDRDTGVTHAALDRDGLAITQTPQGFKAGTLREAYATFDGDATDDAEVLRHAGLDVVSVEGHRDSVKITYSDDLDALHAVVVGAPNLRIGVGVDAHRFETGTSMVVAGRVFESSQGLSGHSDGDVVLHAITDALLGAAGLGDLGTHFGTSRPEFAGAPSTVFLDKTLEMLEQRGYRPQSVSVQYIGNEPRLGAVRGELSDALTALVGAPVHLSATTTDGMGLTGNGEGAAAIAQALVVRHESSAEPGK